LAKLTIKNELSPFRGVMKREELKIFLDRLREGLLRAIRHAKRGETGRGENRQKKWCSLLFLTRVDTCIRKIQNVNYKPAKIDYERYKYNASRHDRARRRAPVYLQRRHHVGRLHME
jgi:hypothetical protein